MIHLDLETRSPVDLKASGLFPYAAQAEIIVAAWYDDQIGAVQQWDFTSGGKPKLLIEALQDQTVKLAAHNAQFERVLLREAWGIDTAIERWSCTAVMARRLNAPASLEKAAVALGLPEDKHKDRRGKNLIRKFCVPEFAEPEGQDWQDFIDYCVQDVVVEHELYRTMQCL